jgi:DnaJ-class molecular chaperone
MLCRGLLQDTRRGQGKAPHSAKSANFKRMQSASIKDIKKQYRKLSKKFHPDKSKEKGAKDRFLEVSQAFEVLSDDDKRKIYDRHGEEGLKRQGQHESHSPFDMFRNFFGGGGRQQERRTPNMVTEVIVDLADLCRRSTDPSKASLTPGDRHWQDL